MSGMQGRCYCGTTKLVSKGAATIVSYCHCASCRRWTGAPVACFAAFPADAIEITPAPKSGWSGKGVTRYNCGKCGSPLMAMFDYLPGQSYVPVGILDDAGALRPAIHSHSDEAIEWLHIDDDLPRSSGTARDELQKGTGA